MKIFHTADWHLGKNIFNVHLTEDQGFLLEQLIEAIEKEKPDLLIIAGDIYDRSIPPVEAVELLNDVLTKIITTTDTKVIIIAGNHDSPDRLNFAGKIIERQGLYIISKAEKEIRKITLEDEFGAINFYPIPYTEPAVIRELYADEELRDSLGEPLKINTHEKAIELLLSKIDLNKKERNICISHGYVVSGDSDLEESRSERPLSIGGSASIPTKHYEGFDYVALGHLHGPQKVGAEDIRYAGSLMKYSFSEVKQKKEVRIIEVSEKGKIQHESLRLKPRRDLRLIKGTMQEITDKDFIALNNSADYIKAIITDKGELLDPMAKLRQFYPNILSLEIEKETAGFSELDLQSNKIEERSTTELFHDFFQHATCKELNTEQKETLDKISAKLNKAKREK